MSKQKYEMEIGAFERVGASSPIEVLMTFFGSSKEGKLEEAYARLSRLAQTEEERNNYMFNLFLNRYNNLLGFSSETMSKIGEMYKNSDKMKYRNPGAFILGYYILEKGKISKDKLNSKNITEIIDSEEMLKEDLIRYARFILKNYS